MLQEKVYKVMSNFCRYHFVNYSALFVCFRKNIVLNTYQKLIIFQVNIFGLCQIYLWFLYVLIFCF